MKDQTQSRQRCCFPYGFIIGVLILGGGLSAASALAEPNNASFLKQYWERPLPAQGKVPEHFSELEASLDPAACGTCHAQQLSDWQQSLHSKAMGPGLMGQLVDMPAHARNDHQSCLRCHAPLSEQADALVGEIEQLEQTGSSQSGGLHREGLVCAACHVRGNQRFGPPRRDGSSPKPGEILPHNGWTVTKAFEDSRFCAACHQFEPGDFALNGKLLENTYVEWQQSRYGKEGISCQQCHMPDRRHQWRGIHDPEMVRQGVTIASRVEALEGSLLKATLSMTNTGTGHRFPTYVTPQVVMHGYQEATDGTSIEGTDAYFVVARRVALNLSQELFDTRLAPGETATLDYEMAPDPKAARLVLRVWVEPDFFYASFYQSVLGSGQTKLGASQLTEALNQAQQSYYILHEERLDLGGV